MSEDHDLREAIRELPGTGGPSFEALLARLEQRAPETTPAPANRSLAWLAIPGLLAAAVAAFALLPTEGVRDRGTATAPAVHLEAVAESARGVRALRSGDRVAADERVVFRVSTDGPGHLDLHAGAEPILVGPVEAGQHVPGGASPLSWRPDGALRSRRIEATLCPAATERAGCRTDALELWFER